MTVESKPLVRNWPWGLTGAVLLLVSVEFAVRAADPVDLIPNERGLLNYKANRLAMQSLVVPDVVFVGSSRTQQGILPGLFQDIIRKQKDSTTVGNYAVGGSLATENVPMLRLMLEQKQLPSTVIYGVTMDQVRGDELYSERSAIYSNLDHWYRDRERLGEVVESHFSEVVRNEISNFYLTFRYRDRPFVALRDLGREVSPKPFLGDAVAEHQSEDQLKLKDDPSLRADIRKHLEDVHLKNGQYNFNDAKFEMISNIIRQCKAAGIQVILFEPPNSQAFNEELPPGTLAEYRSRFQWIADEHEIPFVTLDELKTEFVTREFKDPVHLNTAGARHLTTSLAEFVTARRLIP